MIGLRLAWRNLWRHARRTWLTVSAIAFVAGLLVFMITIQLGAYDMIIDNSLRVFPGQMQVQRAGYQDKPQMRASIPQVLALADTLRTTTGAEAVAARAFGFALVASRERSVGVQVVGVEPQREAEVSTIPRLIQSGRYLDALTAQEAVIGAVLARNLKLSLGDELVLLGSGRDGSMAATVVPVVGIFASGVLEMDRSIVEMPLGTFQDVFSMGDAGHVIVVNAADLDTLPQVLRQVQERLPDGEDLVVLPWEKVLAGLKQLIQADMAQNWFLYISLIVIVTFSILNTFLMAVLERTREFGIMLALGARPWRIGGLVLLESLLLCLIGLAIGMLLGGAVALYFYIEGFTFPGMKEMHAQFGLPGVITPQLSWISLTLGPAVILLFTLLAALYPALRIRRLQPVEAMRAV